MNITITIGNDFVQTFDWINELMIYFNLIKQINVFPDYTFIIFLLLLNNQMAIAPRIKTVKTPSNFINSENTKTASGNDP